MDDNLKVFTIPGLYGSGPRHWQTRWETLYGFTRIEQSDWDNPQYWQWERSLHNHLGNETGKPSVLVAHSLGCHLVIKSYLQIKDWISGILFVAPPDLGSGILQKDLSDFKTDTSFVIDIPSYLVYSEDDPFASIEYSERLVNEFGLTAINIGKKGHINSDSNLGDWDEGHFILKRLISKCLN